MIEETSPAASPLGDHPTADEVRSWSGFRLDELNGAPAGWVDGAYVDAEKGAVKWLLIRRGRLGSHCLVPARDAVGAAEHVWVPWDRGAIRSAHEVKGGEPLTVGAELELCDHYGIGGDAGRPAELAGRPRNAISSRPPG
jgi:hypothetical protein